MIITKRKFLLCITAIMLILLIAFSAMPRHVVFSYAANTDMNFDDTYVIDDLKNTVIDGKDYSLEENNFFADFGFNSKKETQLFSFVEYCYSFYENLQSNYGLYVYVYNPKGIKFVADSAQNKISMRVGADKSAEYKKYTLLYLNQCNETNYEGLFYKYKILLPLAERQRILETLNSSERVYSISEVELQPQNSDVKSYYVATDYFYSGYAAGYGANADAESTLAIKSEQADTLPLDVYSTFFRPSGTNSSSDYTQDTLHSVYFAVPNIYLNTYGEMVAVHALWLNAVMNWGLVTGHKESYDIIREQFIGKTPDNGILPSMFGLLPTVYDTDLTNPPLMSSEYLKTEGLPTGDNIGLYKESSLYYNPICRETDFYTKRFTAIERLYYVYYSGSGDNSADSYTVSSEQIMQDMRNYSDGHGKEVCGRYSRELFESVDNEYTEVNWDYKTDWSDKLTSRKLEQSFWDKLFGKKGSYVVTDTFKDVYAIKELVPADFTGKTVESVCRDLLIRPEDYLREETGLKAVYDKATEHGKGEKDSTGKRHELDSTVYLFRYRVSAYEAREAKRFTQSSVAERAKVRDTNNYFFKQSVDLDFDIIDVTFSNGEKDTVIPVAMSPIDIVHAATPPVYVTDDTKSNVWKIILGIILLVLLIVLLQVTGVLPFVVKAIVWIITLPFRGIAALFKGIQKAIKKKKDGI